MLGQRGGRQRGNKTARRPEGSLAADPRLDDSVTHPPVREPGLGTARGRYDQPAPASGVPQCLIEISKRRRLLSVLNLGHRCYYSDHGGTANGSRALSGFPT